MDEQRYCNTCSMWFHTECLGEAERKRKVWGPLGRQLASLPIVRGWMSSPPADWMTVGSGRLVKKAKSSSKACSQELGELLGEGFISFATTTPAMFFFYACPRCKGKI